MQQNWYVVARHHQARQTELQLPLQRVCKRISLHLSNMFTGQGWIDFPAFRDPCRETHSHPGRDILGEALVYVTKFRRLLPETELQYSVVVTKAFPASRQDPGLQS